MIDTTEPANRYRQEQNRNYGHLPWEDLTPKIRHKWRKKYRESIQRR